MGLDMWATKSKETDEKIINIADWRKHNRLHGYMQQLWEDKGCPNSNGDTPETFNCVPLELIKEDLEELKATILTRALPETQGFFFGHDSYDWSKDELKEAGVQYKAGKFPFKASGRARASEESDGFVKILSDATTDEVLGVHMIGPRCADMIAEAGLAIDFRASAEDLGMLPHAHPSFTEAVKEAALAATENRALHC